MRRLSQKLRLCYPFVKRSRLLRPPSLTLPARGRGHRSRFWQNWKQRHSKQNTMCNATETLLPQSRCSSLPLAGRVREGGRNHGVLDRNNFTGRLVYPTSGRIPVKIVSSCDKQDVRRTARTRNERKIPSGQHRAWAQSERLSRVFPLGFSHQISALITP